jgi:hypothetical protein
MGYFYRRRGSCCSCCPTAVALLLLLVHRVDDSSVDGGRRRESRWYRPSAAARLKNDDDATTAPFLNVKDFGAQGDDSVDDTIAVQHAIDAIPGRGILVFPPGRYLISDTLNTSAAGNHLMGSGSGIFSGPELFWVGAANGTLL